VGTLTGLIMKWFRKHFANQYTREIDNTTSVPLAYNDALD